MILSAVSQSIPYSTQSNLTNSDISAGLKSEPTQTITVLNQGMGSADTTKPDEVTLSRAGLRRSHQNATGAFEKSRTASTHQQAEENNAAPSSRLSAEEQQALQQLKQRDREVRTHEQAHLARAGQYAAGGPSYTYQTGPDGRRYAVGGEVPIDISKERTPEQTIQKMRAVQSAALAPANPSSADQNIAAAASMKEAEAIREMNSPENDSESQQNISQTNSTESSSGNRVQDPAGRQGFQATYA